MDQKTRVTKDLIAWNELLKGSAEVSGGNKVGGILGARGCITRDAASGIFQVAVAWQATDPGGAPPAHSGEVKAYLADTSVDATDTAVAMA